MSNMATTIQEYSSIAKFIRQPINKKELEVLLELNEILQNRHSLNMESGSMLNTDGNVLRFEPYDKLQQESALKEITENLERIEFLRGRLS